MTRPHLVLLGAGASKQACPSGDRQGRQIPVMADLVEVVGLADLIDPSATANFEAAYSALCTDASRAAQRQELERRVRGYFEALEIPDEATVYDHLVLSLRPKDAIATFNWDPFLMQAYQRNHGHASTPRLMFLHGNVAVGHCGTCRTKGPLAAICAKCGRPFEPTQILYPVADKSYTDDAFLAAEWAGAMGVLANAYIVTIFGYSAPRTDIRARDLMMEAWRSQGSRELEQFEVIDCRPQEQLRASWDDFITEHHYQTTNDFFASWIAQHPRRSCEQMWDQLVELAFPKPTPAPRVSDVAALQAWFAALIAEEQAP